MAGVSKVIVEVENGGLLLRKTVVDDE